MARAAEGGVGWVVGRGAWDVWEARFASWASRGALLRPSRRSIRRAHLHVFGACLVVNVCDEHSNMCNIMSVARQWSTGSD